MKKKAAGRKTAKPAVQEARGVNRTLAVSIIFAVVATAVYWRAFHAGFVWDDDTILTENALIKAHDGLYWIWCSTLPLDYWPLTNSSFWIEWRLWGMDAAGYHVTNVALHTSSAIIFWALLRRLKVPGAFLAALLFLVHPVNVESVAWITQRKNTLSMVLFLLSMLWYLRFDERPSARWYGLSLGAFILAMLSKGSVAPLPFLLLLAIWWRHDRVTTDDVKRLVPFLAVAVALTLVNIWFQSHRGHEIVRHVSPVERVLGAAAVVWFYLYKALVPIHLVFVYPQWRISAADVRWWLPLAAAVGVTIGLWSQRRRGWGRASLFAWLFFGIALAPVAGLTDVYFMKYSLVADHYQYNAMLAVVALVAAGIATFSNRASAAD